MRLWVVFLLLASCTNEKTPEPFPPACKSPCQLRLGFPQDRVRAVGTIQSMPTNPPPDSPGMPFDCGSQHCVLYRERFQQAACLGKNSCYLEKKKILSSKIIDSTTLCALDACIPAQFAPILYKPRPEYTFTGGTKLRSPFYPGEGDVLYVGDTFLNANSVSIQSNVGLRIEAGMFVIGQLPEVQEVVLTPVRLVATNSGGTLVHDFKIRISPRSKGHISAPTP